MTGRTAEILPSRGSLILRSHPVSIASMVRVRARRDLRVGSAQSEPFSRLDGPNSSALCRLALDRVVDVSTWKSRASNPDDFEHLSGYNHSHDQATTILIRIGPSVNAPTSCALSVSVTHAPYSCRSPSHAASFQRDCVGDSQTLDFAILFRAGRRRSADGRSAYGTTGRSRGATNGLCGYVQFATP